jgi:hypothetical protein
MTVGIKWIELKAAARRITHWTSKTQIRGCTQISQAMKNLSVSCGENLICSFSAPPS